ncbi:MAG: hypothetical protein JNL21_34405 [Myxococcales bacterium]|nr:hypothetical protein [Myxococcales bacterium]
MTRSIAAGALIALLGGCGGVESPRPRAAGPRPAPAILKPASRPFLPDDARAEGLRRPSMVVKRFDYEELPIVDFAAHAPARAPRIDLRGGRLAFDEPLVAWLKIGNREGFTPVRDDGGSVGIAPPSSATCPHDDIVSDARWVGLSRETFTDEAIELQAAEGIFRWKTCEAAVDWFVRFRAEAIVPGFVYAARVRGEQGSKAERLWIVLPPAAWVSASGAASRASLRGPFTLIRVTPSAGAATSFAARLAPESLQVWRQVRGEATPLEWIEPAKGAAASLLLDLDVVSAEGGWEGTVSIGTTPGYEAEAYADILSRAR